MTTTCSMAVQVNLEDKIPFVDAEGSCDGSVSSIGTGSLLGHSTTSEEFISESSKTKGSNERLWRYQQPVVKQALQTDDQHSLNNILDTVSSSRDSLDGTVSKDMNNASPASSSCKIVIKDYEKVSSMRPTSLTLVEGKGKKEPRSQLTTPGGYVSLMSAYTSLSEQVRC